MKHKLCNLLLTITVMGILFIVFPKASYAANKYWVGSSGADVGTASNWKTSDPSGCGGGDAVSLPTTDTYIFDADCDNDAVISASRTFANITLSSGYTGTVSVTNTPTITVNSGMAINDGTFTANNATLDINGTTNTFNVTSPGVFNAPSSSGTFTLTVKNITITTGTFNHNSGTVVFDYGGDQNVSVANATFWNLTTSKSSGGLLTTGAINVDNNLTLGTGASGYITNTSSAQVNLKGNFTSNTGNSSAPFYFIGSNSQTASGFDYMNSTAGVFINKSGGSLRMLAAINDFSGTPLITVQEGVFDLDGWGVSITGSNGFVIQDGGTVRVIGGETFGTGDAPVLSTGSTVEYAGDGDGATDTYSTFSWSYHHLKVNTDDGSNDAYNLAAAHTVAGDVTVTSGILDLNTYSLNPTGSLTVQTGAFLRLIGSESPKTPTLDSGSTVIYDGTSSYTVKDWGYHHLTFNGSGGTFTLGANESIGGTLTATLGTFDTSTYDMVVTGNVALSGGTVDFSDAACDVDINGNVTLASGTLSAPAANDSTSFTVAGNWTNSGGSFTTNSGMVNFDGTSQNIYGTSTFYSLYKAVTSAATLGFEESTTTTINGGATFQGASGQLLSIRTATTGGGAVRSGDPKSIIDFKGSVTTATYLDVRDSRATSSNSAVPLPIDPSSSNDSGNNLKWFAKKVYVAGKKNGSGAFDTLFNGTIDDVRVYTRTLGQKDVDALYDSSNLGPVGYWKLDEGTSTAAGDSSNNGNGGTLTNSPTWTSGKYGNGVNFGGSNKHIIVSDPSNAVLDFADDASMSFGMWFTHGTASAQEILLSKFNEAGYKLIMESDGDLTCALDYDSTWTPTDSITSTLATYDDSNWHHVMCVKNGASSLTLYIDGVAIGSDSSLTATNTLTNSDPVYFGIDADGTSNDYTGVLDDIRIYNYALSPKQIVSIMNADHPNVGSPVGSPVAYWKFDEGFGITSYDGSSNANNLTLSAQSYTTSGVQERAWNGDGAKWLYRTDDPDLDFAAADDFTISFWLKSDSASNPGAVEYLVNKASATSAGYAIYAQTDGDIVFGIDDDATWSPDDTAGDIGSDIYDGTWHNIVATKTGTTRVDFYVDGRLKSSDTSIAATATLENALSFYVGDRDGVNNGDEFNGDIDEVKVYRFALTTDEVLLEYTGGKSQVLGSLSTTSNGSTPSNSYDRSLCVPGDTGSCSTPVAHWKFDEGTGSTAYDSMGTYSGTFNGNTTWGVGKLGRSVAMDGSGDFLQVATSAIISTSSSATASTWVYLRSLSSDTDIYAEHKSDGVVYYMRVTSAGKLEFGIYRSSGMVGAWTTVTGNTTISANKWYHLAVSLDSSNNMYVYVNGILDGKTTGSGPANDTITDVEIGRINNAGGLDYVNGFVDDLRLYNVSLTASQVAWMYSQGAPIVHYGFDECTGTTINNSSADGNGDSRGFSATLTLGASPASGTCATSGAWYNGATGKLNSSMSFDGTDDTVKTSNVAIVANNTSTYTGLSFGGWMKPAGATLGLYMMYKDQEFSLYGGAGSSVPYCDVYLTGSGWGSGAVDTETFTVGEWKHVMCVFDGSTVKLYVNGTLRASASRSGTVTSSSSYPLVISGDADGVGNNFNGLLDEMMVFNYALTPAQVRTVYNNGVASFK